MSKLNTPLSRLAWAIGAALLTFSAGANAVVVLTADTTASTNGNAITPVNSSGPGYVNSYANGSGSLGYSYGYSFARDNGAYAVSSNAKGIATATATTSFGQSITNDSGSAQHYSMNFHIYHGFLSTALNGNAVLSGTEFLKAIYSANISVNGSNVFTSSAMVKRDANSTSGSKTGVDLNAADSASDGALAWNDSYYTIDLGTVASGGTINVLASLADETSSNVGTYTFDHGGCCSYGYGCYGSTPLADKSGLSSTDIAVAPCNTTDFKGSATAFYGDPINFNNAANAEAPPNGLFAISATSATSDVPEPGVYGLIFLALGAAGWAGRRRRQGQPS